MNMFEPTLSCRVCGAHLPQNFFDLGSQPLANSLLDSPNDAEQAYPLALTMCRDCTLVQLTHTVPPEILFTEYVWVTGTSAAARAYAEIFCEWLIGNVDSKDGYVLELASNDGTFLKPFQARGFDVLGVDPARNVAKMAEKNGVPTRVVFWGEDEAGKLRKEKGCARIVFARNVLPHVAGTKDFITGCRTILADDAVLAIEVHDAYHIQNELQYDSIYHEHLCYFTLASLERLLRDAGLFAFDIQESPISGGAMVVLARLSASKESQVLRSRRVLEERGYSNTEQAWNAFARRAQQHRENFRALLKEAHKTGDTVVGYGASARSSTLLNFCGIDTGLISTIIDKNQLKQGKYTAGTHIPIKSPEDTFTDMPDTIVLLAWNFKDEIKRYLKDEFSFNGNYLVPLPETPHWEI